MGTVRYTVFDGEITSEYRNGVLHDYLVDPLGSTVALVDNTQTITDTFSYSAFGEVVNRTGTTPTPFQYVGNQGYYRDSSTRTHVRARNFYVNLGKWSTQDPIGFNGGDWNLYRYVNNNPINYSDPSGLANVNCNNTGHHGILRRVIDDICKVLHRAKRNEGFGGVKECLQKKHLGEIDTDCLLRFCRIGTVSCDDSLDCHNCQNWGQKTKGPPCACSNASAVSRLTVCSGVVFPKPPSRQPWNNGCGSCGNDDCTVEGYVSCESPRCEGKQGHRSLLHELMHMCATSDARDEEKTDRRSCCFIDQLF